MNLDKLAQKLMGAAKRAPLDERVPYGFEQRVLSRLSASAAPAALSRDDWASWARALWCSAAVCSAFTILLGVWLSHPLRPPESELSFSQDLEQSILAAMDDGESTW